MMVVVKLIGGLGNQLFQYAAGRSLAHRLKAKLKLDVSAFQSYKLRTYKLSHYSIKEEFASENEIAGFESLEFSRRKHFINVLCGYVAPTKKKVIFREPVLMPVRREMFGEVGSFYLDGYWQSEKYFSHINNIIREEFRLKTCLSGRSLRMANEIQGCNSVSMHIRRGDYAYNPKTNTVHGVCEKEYYYRCVEKIASTTPDLRIFIFSDDMGWVVENMRLPCRTTHVAHNGEENDYEDLSLMSMCKHHIIANSSFSWWGAWLSTNPDKIVFAPREWFRDASIHTSDLIPKDWVVL